MSINRLRQLGAGSKPQPNPVDEDWGAGWGDSEEDLDFGNDWDKGKGRTPGTGEYNDPDIGESDDFDDFGAKEANIKNLDDDTPPEIDQNVGADEEDDSDMDGLGFDLQEAITEGKRAAVVDEKKLKVDLKLKVAEEEARIKQKEDEIIARRISEKAKEEEENRKNRQKAELEQIKNSIRDRVEVSMSRNKGSTIEKGSRDESKGGASEDLEAFLGQLDNKKDKPKDSFQFDGSSIANNPIDDNKSFEEFEVAEKFAELDQDEPITIRATRVDISGKSGSNADQLALLQELNSQARSIEPSGRAGEFQMTDDKAIVLEDDEANQSLNEESADNALDNFLARAESGAQESDLNILGDNFLGKIDKNSKPTSKGTLGKLSQEPAFSSSTAKVLPKQTGKVFSTKNLLPAPKPSARKYPMTSVKLNAVDREDTRRQLEDKDIEIMKLETQLSGIVGQKDVISYELVEARKRIVQLEASRDKLEEDLQVKDSAVQEALLSRKAAEVDSQNKTRLLKERQELASRSYVNSAIENQKRVYESEIEKRNLKIEMLEANLKAAEDRLKLSVRETSRFGESDGLNAGRLQQTDFFAIKDADSVELRLKVKKLEAMLADCQAYNDRNGSAIVDKDAVVIGSLARGLTKENERLIREIGVLKAAMAEWKSQSAGQSKGKMDLSAEEATELKATVKRLQEELINKDNFYRDREEANKIKLAMFDSVEKALKQSERESRELKDQLAERQAETEGYKMKISNQEFKIKNFSAERNDLAAEIMDLKNDNQELKIILADSEQARDAKGQTSKSEKQRKAEEDLHPLEFNLTVSNTNGTKTRFNNFIEPPFNPITPSRGQTVMPERIQEDEPLRKSVLVKDSSQSYETRKRLVKSVLQRLETGNIYQKANDLLDSALIMFSKRFDVDMQAALQQLKDLIISFDEALPVDGLEDLVKLIFTQMHENDSAGASQTLGDLEKVFINSFYDFMPDYLGRNKGIKIAGSEKKKLAKELEMPIELEKLRQDNEKLKKDVGFLKEQKLSLEKIIQDNPRSARDVDFAILEKKLAILERNQKMKAMEINSGLKDLYNTPSDEEAWRLEKEKLLKIIKQKNKEIKSFRQELDTLLGHLDSLKKK